MSLRLWVMLLISDYYFWWRDYSFSLLIHYDALFHFMVSICADYKYKRLVKATFKYSILFTIHHLLPIFSRVQPASPTSIDRM